MHGYYLPPRRKNKAREVNPDPFDYRPIVEAMDDPVFRANEEALLYAIGIRYPTLGIYGWLCGREAECGPGCMVCPGGRRGRPICDGNYGPPVSSIRRAKQNDQVEAFAIARRWLPRLPQSKTLRGSSYAWKHILERECDGRVYVANGIFLCACIDAGIRQKRCEGNSPNSWLGLKSPPNDFESKIWAGSRIERIESSAATVIPFAPRPT
jgi:hypothetical protein